MLIYGKKLNLKRFITLLLCIIIIAISLLLGSCSLLYRDISFMNDEISINNVSISGCSVLATGDDGNVYYYGSDVNENFSNGFPADLSNEIKMSNFLQGRKFIRMYDRGDAKKAYIASYGGAVLTQQNDVYLFLNNNTDQYCTPTLFCSGYTDIELFHDTVYLLSENGEFGYIEINGARDFNSLVKGVQKFRIAVNKEKHVIIFALTDHNDLYIYDTTEPFDESTEHFENIKDFDFCEGNTYFQVLGLLNTKQRAIYYVLDWDELSYEAIQLHTGEITGEKINEIAAYGTGVAMLDDDDNLYLYGGDLDRHYSREFTGDKVMENVRTVDGSNDSLFVVKKDGSYHYFGNNGDNTYTPIIQL